MINRGRCAVRLIRAIEISSLLLLCFTPRLQAQDKARGDTTITFGSIQQAQKLQPLPVSRTNSWGIDLMVSTNGFGLGTFYRHEYSDELSGFLDFSISEAKDDDEVEYIDIYGNTFTPGKVNRFLVMPVFLGLEKRLFKDDILDNFRPYINGAAGPAIIYVFPYDQEYFSALGKGQPKYTFGGYIGVGAFFGSEQSNILGLNLRYYYLPYFSGLESLQNVSKTQFGGFYITLNFGSTL
jgi:hypothetical protein